MATATDPDAAARNKWRSEGVPGDELDLLATLAPLSSRDLQWEMHGRDAESGEFLMVLRCPNCGSEIRYRLNAVDDFYCDDCDFDVHNDEIGRQPAAGTF